MRVVLAPDGFGGTLSAVQACAALAEGWRRTSPGDELVLAPLSDGGPGLVEVLAAALPGARLETVVVPDPLGRPVPAALLRDGTTAWVESAAACGLHLVAPDERDVRRASTRGVGALVAAALDGGAERVVVGLGGSATTDGGAGLLAALGLDPGVPDGGAALAGATALSGSLDPRLAGVDLVAATDVDAPLLGPRGASAVFGPQKGATPDDVRELDAALGSWADLLERHLGADVREAPGAGAAGGLGFALLALGARRRAGLDLVAEAVGLDGAVAAADLVVTGEGRFDATSLTGKVCGGVAARAAAAGVPCLVLAGQVAVGRREAAARGVEESHALTDLVGLETALSDPAGSLAALAQRVAGQWGGR